MQILNSNFTLKIKTDEMQTSQFKHLMVPAVWPGSVFMSSFVSLKLGKFIQKVVACVAKAV